MTRVAIVKRVWQNLTLARVWWGCTLRQKSLKTTSPKKHGTSKREVHCIIALFVIVGKIGTTQMSIDYRRDELYNSHTMKHCVLVKINKI